MTLVVDAGPLVAALVASDPNHGACSRLIEVASRPLVVPVLAIAEVAHFVRRHHGAEAALVRALRSGELVPEPVEPADWDRIHELVEQYDGLGLGIVDASVVAVCERLGMTTLATLDHRHFSVVRPRHCDVLELVP